MCKFKKMISALTASALSLAMYSVMPSTMAVGETAKLIFSSECEDLELSDGATVATKVYNDEYPGFTGDGFVWVASGGNMTFTVDVAETGMYRLVSRSIMYLGSDGEIREGKVSVERADGTEWEKTVKIPHTSDWNDYSFGDIKLTKGENKITFGGGWGYCLYDSVTLTQTPPPDYSVATDTLVDAKATDEAKALMKYLKSVYGNHIISGQQEIYGGGNDGDSELEFDYIKDKTGKLPAIRGFDFMNYNPLYGWEDGTTERAIKWAKENNGIVTASWHINVPIDFENYELGDAVDWQKCTYQNYQKSNSTFNTANILVEDSKERAYFEEAMKDLAEQLLKLQDANVPIILRPLHEAQGNEGNYGDGTSWFWWGDRGSDVYKELWKLLYNTLTETYGLHNIIWEFNSYNYSNSPTWYPGDEYVDIVAYDKYNVQNNRDDGLSSGPNLSAISSIYNYLVELTGGKKMVAMAENDTIPALDNLTVENAGWLYFCPWYGEHLMSDTYQDVDNLKEIYTSDYCITLDELPEDLYKLSDTEPTTVTTATTATTSTKETTTTSNSDSKVLYGDATLDGSVDIADAVAVASFVGDSKKNPLSADALANADVQNVGDGVTANDALAIQQFLAGSIKELPV